MDDIIRLENDGESEVCCMCYKHESGHVPDAILTICGPKSCHICGNEIPLCRKHAEQLINELRSVVFHRATPPDPYFDRDKFHDYVLAHGCGAPTEEGYALGKKLMLEGGDDYATAAFEVVFRSLTEQEVPK